MGAKWKGVGLEQRYLYELDADESRLLSHRTYVGTDTVMLSMKSCHVRLGEMTPPRHTLVILTNILILCPALPWHMQCHYDQMLNNCHRLVTVRSSTDMARYSPEWSQPYGMNCRTLWPSWSYAIVWVSIGANECNSWQRDIDEEIHLNSGRPPIPETVLTSSLLPRAARIAD